MYELAKVFDCNQMPRDVRSIFIEWTEGISNDVYVAWDIKDGFIDEDQKEKYNKVSQWLRDNGATEEDTIIVSHWW
jgi:hypothetical protein